MNAAREAREFARLRDLQRLLRYYERQHGPIFGLREIRQHVIDQMRRIAKLVRCGMPVLALLLIAWPALAQEHRHGDELIYGATGRFYETWMRPDQPASSCCNRNDCDTAVDVKTIGGKLWARKKNGGPLVSVPPEKIEQSRDSPDGLSHLCAIGSTPLCFIYGTGG